MSELRAGWARVQLALPSHYPMTGYIARQAVSEGTLDPLYVRALVLEQDQLRIAILVVDVLLVSSTWAESLRKSLAKLLHNSAEHVVIAATHTHSGPLVDTSPFQLSSVRADGRTRQLMRALERQCTKAVTEANSKLRQVSVSHLRCSIRGLATDRTRRSRNPIQWLHLIRLDADDASALFGVLPCHPTILGATNVRYSGDLHGEVARRYEKQFDVALIANGAAANISTRFTRSSQTHAQVVRSAVSILRQARRQHFRTCFPCPLSSVSRFVDFPVRDFHTDVNYHLPYAGRVVDVMREGALVAKRLSKTREFRRSTVTVPIMLVRLGPIWLAALPMELYAETGRFLWTRTKTIALCYANGYWGYVYGPQAKAFDYEVVSSPFDERADRLIRRTVLDLQEDHKQHH